MLATLKVHTGSDAGKTHELNLDQAVLGRNAFCDIVIPVHSISRQHARIVREGEQFYLEDMGSLNGTFINGQRISGRSLLKDSDRIHLYEVLLTFHDGTPASVTTSDTVMGQTVTLPVFDPLAPSVMSEDANRQRPTTIVETLDAAEPRVGAGSEEKLRAVLGLTRNLGRSLALDEFLPNILDSLFEIFPQADRGYVLLADRPNGKLMPAAVKDRRNESGSSLTLAPISHTIAARVMAEGKAILSTDSELNDAELGQSIFDEAVCSMMTVPLVGPSRIAVGIIHIDTTDAARRFSQDDLEVLISVATVAGQAVDHARVHQASLKLDRRERELSTAREVQLHFLPQTRPDVPGYRFFDYYRAADDVGGDYFGYVALPDGRWAIAVGDVSGKGVSAALMMARLCSEVRYCLVTTGSPVEAVLRLNRDLIDPTMDDRFVTFLLVVLDPAKHTLTVVNAGHMPPILRRWASGTVDQLGIEEAGPPLGFDPVSKYAACVVTIEPGDTVTLYTDGISEATSADENVYGIKRLCRTIASGPVDAERLGPMLLEDVDRFVGDQPQTDDICLLVVGRPRPKK
jgi:sigma-B regulation protein RsbU (phosphoserine phosphatase)